MARRAPWFSVMVHSAKKKMRDLIRKGSVLVWVFPKFLTETFLRGIRASKDPL